MALPPELERLRQQRIESAGEDIDASDSPLLQLPNLNKENNSSSSGSSLHIPQFQQGNPQFSQESNEQQPQLHIIKVSPSRGDGADDDDDAFDLEEVEDLPVNPEQERKALLASANLFGNNNSNNNNNNNNNNISSKNQLFTAAATASPISKYITTSTTHSPSSGLKANTSAAGTNKKDFVSPIRTSMKPRHSPQLIRSLNTWTKPVQMGKMVYNPETNSWDGNEEDVKDFDKVGPSLISNLGGSKTPKVVGKMVFDPKTLKWIGNEEDMSAFDEFEDDDFSKHVKEGELSEYRYIFIITF